MLEKYLRTVKGQLSYFDTQIRRWSPDRPGYDPNKLTTYRRLGDEFRDLLGYLLQQRRIEQGAAQNLASPAIPSYEPQYDPEPAAPDVAPAPTYDAPALKTSSAPSSAAERDDDLSDLPPELLKELSDSFKGETDPVITIINERGGTASIDEILVDLYRKYDEIGKRPIISNKLYRFSRRGLCAPVPGKKGLYTTDPTIIQAANEEEEEDPDSEPSGSTSNNGKGVAGLQEGPSKPSPVGSIPSTSTSSKMRRELFASTAIPSYRKPQ